jgi:hypothetical protein
LPRTFKALGLIPSEKRTEEERREEKKEEKRRLTKHFTKKYKQIANKHMERCST